MKTMYVKGIIFSHGYNNIKKDIFYAWCLENSWDKINFSSLIFFFFLIIRFMC